MLRFARGLALGAALLLAACPARPAARPTVPPKLQPAACEDGDAADCLRSGASAVVKHDLELATSMFLKGCDAGGAESCWRLGLMYEYGRGVPGDTGRGLWLQKRARRLSKAACYLGNADDCRRAAEIQLGADGIEYVDSGTIEWDTLEYALELYEAACEQRDANACYWVGVLVAAGAAPDGADSERAATLFAPLCAAGEARACLALAALDVTDQEHMQRLWRRACELGEGRGCQQLADEGIDEWEAVQKRAAKLFRDSCDRGDAAGCDGLANALYNGYSERADAYERALQRWGRACELGRVSSCQAMRDYEGYGYDY